VQLLELAKLLRSDAALMRRLCPDLATPSGGGLRDLMDALALAEQLGEETVALNKAVRRSASMERAAQASSRPELALAYLRAADRVIQVDDFAP
jgi:acyl-CoA dehydrogenase